MVPRWPAFAVWNVTERGALRLLPLAPSPCTEALDPARSPAGGVLLLHDTALTWAPVDGGHLSGLQSVAC
jgi:hypothetical protein